MLRRTQTDILKTNLPEKKDALLLCYMSEAQCVRYKEAAREVFDSVDLSTPGVCYIEPSMPIPDASAEGMENDDCQESNVVFRDSSKVLPGLLKLRKICNYVHDENGAATASVGVESILRASGKLQLLSKLISVIHLESPRDKLVVVSNFTSMLDQVELLAKAKCWSFLRLDGSIPTSKRQGLVDCFNLPLSESKDGSLLGSKIFLLSSKAGGVGINLIGANRLVMMDCDWNPATDRQAMARIWREGQRKPVFIYRMISTGTIEETILKRQDRKLELEYLLNNQETDAAETETPAPPVEILSQLNRRTLVELIFPETMLLEDQMGPRIGTLSSH